MAKKTAKQIVEQTMRGMEILEQAPTSASDSVRRDLRPGPSMADLRKKFLGEDAKSDGHSGTNSNAAADREATDAVVKTRGKKSSDVEVLKVRQKRTAADPADDPGIRTVIISPEKGMLGSQG